MSSLKWDIRDKRDRIILARTNNDQLIFNRYIDMEDIEKKMLLSVYAMVNNLDKNDVNDPKIQTIIKFLNFDDNQIENEFCG